MYRQSRKDSAWKAITATEMTCMTSGRSSLTRDASDRLSYRMKISTAGTVKYITNWKMNHQVRGWSQEKMNRWKRFVSGWKSIRNGVKPQSWQKNTKGRSCSKMPIFKVWTTYVRNNRILKTNCIMSSCLLLKLIDIVFNIYNVCTVRSGRIGITLNIYYTYMWSDEVHKFVVAIERSVLCSL